MHPLSAAGVGLALVVLALQSPVLPPAVHASGLLVALLLVCMQWVMGHGRKRILLLLPVLFLPLRGMESGARWQEQLLPEECVRLPVQLTGVVRGLARAYDNTRDGLWRVDLDVIRLSPTRCEGPRRVRLYIDATMTAVVAPLEASSQRFAAGGLAPGTPLLVTARLRRPWGHVNPAALDGERRHLLDGLHAVGSVSGLQGLAPLDSPSLQTVIDRQRERLSRWILEQGPASVAPLLAALAVGDQRFMNETAWERLRLFGLSHLLVISGMHISLAALPGWWLGQVIIRLTAAPERLARVVPSLFALAASAAYALLAGFSLPTRRALLMLGLLAVPRLLGRPASMGGTLAATVLLLLAIDPLAVLGASFWLSVGAVSLLAWYLAWRPRARGVARVAGVQIFLVLAMAPLGVFFFGGASTVSALCNLIAIPLVSLWVAPLLLLALLLRSLDDDLAHWLLNAAATPFSRFWDILEHGEDAAAATQLSLSLPGQLLWPLVAAAMALVLPRLPGRSLLLVLLVTPALAAGLLRAVPYFELLVFDVGQGLSVLVRSGSRSMLIDTGPGPPGGSPAAVRTVLPALRRYGIPELDLLVISHPDRDHDAGEAAVRAQAPPRAIRRGVAPADSAERCRTGRREGLGERVLILHLAGSLRGDSDNNASCTLLISVDGYRFLLPGDIDHRRERDIAAYWTGQLTADVLLAAHHGSGSSTSRLWLGQVRPRQLIVAAGRANRFGHPATRVLAAAQGVPAEVLTTARDGALRYTLTRNGRLRCRRLRHRSAPFWRRGEGAADCSPARPSTLGIIPRA